MLYKKNQVPELSQELFQNPTSEYRGTPFWAWNCKLEQKELEWQLEILKKMGFGGAHMHVRSGMATPYLSDEYMSLIKACVEKCKKEDMLAWLYDEDRWPSGAAGGLVTKEVRYRSRELVFSPIPITRNPEYLTFLSCYDIKLDEAGYLVDYRCILAEEEAQHEKWYAYQEISPGGDPWYNNQAYVNTLDKAAMDRFIEITYEAYNRTIADDFDKTVPAIFTDEPQFARKYTLDYATEKKEVSLPWTDDLPETFAKAYDGENLMEGLPELFWDRADKVPSIIRYHYHDHVCQRFTEAFADNCGAWCNEHGIALTGHMMMEETLGSQTAALGEAMRSYRGFKLPGIDMLCANFEYTTAKQAQSAVHQFGREGMLSELYGVTNWDFDFRGHKLHGDWQAALGVTIRVPHLSWVSMAGEAKRDYPASINYQSPWWNQYSLVEDHFARVNTAMTRGKAVVKVGVIHPIESYWLHWGPAEQTALVRDNMDQNFQNLVKWLLFGGIDFDFISESLLPDLCREGSAPLSVGEMAYDVVLVPNCETLRSTTLERLESFAAAGGKLIFSGELPTLEDARPSKRGQILAEQAVRIPFNKSAILTELEENRIIEIRNRHGELTENLIYQMREDGQERWLFLAHAVEPYNKDIIEWEELRIKIAGTWKVKAYNTLTGKVTDITHQTKHGYTEVKHRMFDYDSLLLRLEPAQESQAEVKAEHNYAQMKQMSDIPVTVPYTLSEPNVLLLDQAEYALDDEDWQAKEEILRLDNVCREKLGWPLRGNQFAQPWVVEEEEIVHVVHLRWQIQSEIACEGISLAIEDAEQLQFTWNGKEVPNTVTGWYVDKSIKTVKLPALKAGENVLEAVIPFGKRTSTEWAYLLGDFGVEVVGRSVRIVAARKELAFGDITRQGLPFYGGNLTYHIPVETKDAEIRMRSSRYRGAMQSVNLDGGKEIPMIYPPYCADLGTVEAGKHQINLTLYGHRRNSFGPVHLTDLKARWIGPNAWRTDEERWAYDYEICEEGILNTPEITGCEK